MKDKELVTKLIHIMKKHRRIIDKKVELTGVHQAQHRLLMCLAKSPFDSQVELAAKMGVTPATVAVSLKNLERDGYIYRQTKESDNRFNHIKLTEKGQKVVDGSCHIFAEVDVGMFAGISEEQRQELKSLLEILDNNLSEIEGRK